MRAELIDLASRAGWTAGETFLATLVLTDVSTWSTAAVAAAAAFLSVVKTYFAQKRAARNA